MDIGERYVKPPRSLRPSFTQGAETDGVPQRVPSYGSAVPVEWPHLTPAGGRPKKEIPIRRHVIIWAIAAASAALLAGMLWDHPAGRVAFAAAALALPVLITALGAVRRGRLAWRVALPLLAGLLLFELSGLGAWGLSGGIELGGASAGLLIVLVGLCIVPLVAAPLLYALCAPREGLTEPSATRKDRDAGRGS